MRRKSDPSRVAERDRRAAGHGDRVAPRDCADAGLGLPARTGGGQAFGTAGCSRCGHGRRPRRWRRAGRTGDRFAGGAGRPRRRSAQGRLRLDSAPNPWHNSRDWLGLSELETVTRAPDGTPGPHPTPESVSYATRTRRPSPAPGLWTLTLLWTQRARPQGACKTAQTRFRTAPTATILVGSSRPGRDGTTGRQRRQPSRFAHFFMTADMQAPCSNLSQEASASVGTTRGGSLYMGRGLPAARIRSQSSLPRLARSRTVEMSMPNWLAIALAVR